jgi:hypothetical protein
VSPSPKTLLQGLSEIMTHLRLPASVHRVTVVRWIKAENLPAGQLSGRWWCDPDELDVWWRSRRATERTRK